MSIFFALLLPFWLRPPGFSLVVPKSPLPLLQHNELFRPQVPLRGALVGQPVVRMLLLTVAVHVVPPLPAAPLDRAFNRQCLHTLLACCPHAELTKKFVGAGNRLLLCPPPPLYATNTEDTAGSPAKSTARGEECCRVQMERNVNPHPSQRYCLATTWHAAHNLPIPPTNHCRQQRNPLVGNNLPRQQCCCLCFGG